MHLTFCKNNCNIKISFIKKQNGMSDHSYRISDFPGLPVKLARVAWIITTAQIVQKKYTSLRKNFLEKKMTTARLVHKYGFMKRWNINLRTAQSILRYAINGNPGKNEVLNEYGIPVYTSIAPETDIKSVHRQHRKKNGSKAGKRAKKTGTSIFAQSPQERVECARQAIIARGKTPPDHIEPFTEQEKRFVMKLAKNKKCMCGSKQNLKMICERVNEIIWNHREVRTPKAISGLIRRINKQKKKARR